MFCFQPLSKMNAAVDSSTLMGVVTALTGFENSVSTTQLGGFRGMAAMHACKSTCVDSHQEPMILCSPIYIYYWLQLDSVLMHSK